MKAKPMSLMVRDEDREMIQAIVDRYAPYARAHDVVLAALRLGMKPLEADETLLERHFQHERELKTETRRAASLRRKQRTAQQHSAAQAQAQQKVAQQHTAVQAQTRLTA